MAYCKVTTTKRSTRKPIRQSQREINSILFLVELAIMAWRQVCLGATLLALGALLAANQVRPSLFQQSNDILERCVDGANETR